jgi:hypothetical protein
MSILGNLPPRPLSPEEEKLLRWILEHGSENAKSYLPQIEGMRARRSCSCGCASICLVVLNNAPAGTAAKDRIVADLSGRTAQGSSVGVLVFQYDCRLSDLEVYPYGDEGESGLPTIESLSA